MSHQLAGDRFFHSALFQDVQQVNDALHDVEEAGISKDQLALFVLQAEKPTAPAKGQRQGDGRRGLILGIGIGGFVGLFMSILGAKLGILSGFFEQTIVLGLLGGMLIGGLSAGLYGMGLKPTPPHGGKPLPESGNCLVTARASDLTTILRVEDIFRKHHALSAGI